MPTCPKGHQSAAADYCDECGAPIGAVPVAAPPVGAGGTGNGGAGAGNGAGPAAGVGEPCPVCATPRADRFCEVCGHDFVAAELGGAPAASGAPAVVEGAPATAPPVVSGSTGAPASPPASLPTREPGGGTGSTWRASVSADAAYHARMREIAGPEAEPIALPAFVPERRFALRGPQMLIGRQSRSRGIEPDIDLTGPPTDPAVSHAHAILVQQPDGAWAVVDLGSANGTYVNEGTEPLEANTPVPLSDGDRVHVGAFSTITLHQV